MRGLIVIAAIFALACVSPCRAGPVGKPSPVVPLGDPGTWVTADDYPQLAIRHEMEGLVKFHMQVGTDGVPTRCDVIESSGYSELDEATCPPLLQRARFKPATDLTGKPVPYGYQSQIRWTLPDGPSTPPKPGLIEIAFTVGANGVAVDCTIENTAGASPEDVAEMLASCAKEVYEPYRDENGAAVAKRVTTKIQVTIEPLP